MSSPTSIHRSLRGRAEVGSRSHAVKKNAGKGHMGS